MKPKTMEDFIRDAKLAIELNKRYMIVKVSIDGRDPEYIINTSKNFEKKTAYYSRTYRQNLEMKSAPNVKIVSWLFTNVIHIGEGHGDL